MLAEVASSFEFISSGAFGIAAGVLSGFLGIGGGVILPPLLVLTLRIEQHQAQGISLAALLPPVGLPAVLAYRRGGVRIMTKLVVALILGFVGGAFAGAWLAHRIPGRELRWLFAAYLVISAWRAMRAARATEVSDPALRTSRASGVGSWLGVPIGAVAGTMSGLLGVGGGLVALPLLRRVGLGRLEAQATTLAMMLPPIGLPAVYVYAREQGGLPWPLLVAVAVGFAMGARLGAHLAGRADERAADLVYAGSLVLMAVVLVIHP